jgi:dipeptidyl aminopeptidase/acylaminoacyl peptidase
MKLLWTKSSLPVFLALLLWTGCTTPLHAQGVLNEEMLWQLKTLSAPKADVNGTKILYGVRSTALDQNKSQTDLMLLDLATGQTATLTQTPSSETDYQWSHDGRWIAFLYPVNGAMQLHRMRPDGSERETLTQIEGGIEGFGLSPSGKHWFYIRKVRLEPTMHDQYPNLSKSTGQVFDQLMHRHWDSWHDGTYSHVFVQTLADGRPLGEARDLMPDQPWHSPLPPMGSSSEIAWSPSGQTLVYPAKKMRGNEAAVSTNSDLYAYDVNTTLTVNISSSNPGYDTDPQFSPDGQYLSWLSMARDGYEADLNRVALMNWNTRQTTYLNTEMDRSAYEMTWSPDAKTLYYAVYHGGFTQIIAHPIHSAGAASAHASQKGNTTQDRRKKPTVNSAAVMPWTVITTDTAHYSGLLATALPPSGSTKKPVSNSDHRLLYLKSTMLRPSELCGRLRSGGVEQIYSTCNDSLYRNLRQAKFESRNIKSSDGQQVQTYIVYPPDFDPQRTYPTLIYCQGGPQSMVGQSFSMRWNFHLMAAKGYIVVAPNRRGLPGFGQAWNEQISGDWGGQAMKDMLWVTDSVKGLPFVDAERMAAVGASFGGYTVYWLAGNHDGRFKSFIAHCGVYNLESMFGQTEEIFFSQWDMKGRPWDRPRPNSYNWYSPHRYVHQWNAPILIIHNEKDYRVPLAQGLEAYTAAQLRGIKTRMLYFPDENHWVIKPQNSVLWQKVFFGWLDETLR